MSCCGGKRQTLVQPLANPIQNDSTERTSLRHAETVWVHFEYTGKTGLTVLGPITGSRYRFSGPGAVVAVDRRDAPSIAAVPNLRRVRSVDPAQKG